MGITRILARRSRKDAERQQDKRRSLVDFIKRDQSDELRISRRHDSIANDSIQSLPVSTKNLGFHQSVPNSVRRLSFLNGLHNWFSSLAPPVTQQNATSPTSCNTPEQLDAPMQLPLPVDIDYSEPSKSWDSLNLGKVNLHSRARSVSSTDPSECSRETVTLRIKDVRLRDSNCTETLELVLARSASLRDLNKILTEKGYESLLGIWSNDRKLALRPEVSIKEPIPVTVTEGPSSYDIDSGLRINKDEKFQAYLAKRQLSVKCVGSQLLVNGGSLKVGFRRTLRVPHDGTHRGLPPDCGLLPVFNTVHFAESGASVRSDGSEDWTRQGGVVVPLYQREAVWLEFEADRPYTIRVYMGGYNTISGLPLRAPRHPRRPDSILVPDQPRITGVTLPNGKMRQLVAMPLASEDMLDKRIPGRPSLTHIQLEITASGPELGFYPHHTGFQAHYNASQSPEQFNVQPGNDVYLRPVCQPEEYPFMGDSMRSERSTLIRELYASEPESFMSKGSVEVRALYGVRLTIKRTDTVARPVVQDFSPFDTIAKVASEVFLNHSPLTEYVIVHNDKEIEQNDITLAELGFGRETLIHARKNYSTITKPTPTNAETEDEDDDLSTIDEDSSDADSGSAVDQSTSDAQSVQSHQIRTAQQATAIHRTLTRRKSRAQRDKAWSKSITSLISIQFPNSAVFEDMTGVLMPPTPVTLQTYAEAGLPFYTVYEEKSVMTGRLMASGGGPGQKSVRSIPLVKVNPQDPNSTLKMGYQVRGEKKECMVCQGRAVDCILRPCNHVFCYNCVAKKMTNHVIISCAICHSTAWKILGLSAPVAALKGNEEGKEPVEDVITTGAWEMDCPTDAMFGAPVLVGGPPAAAAAAAKS